jgi:AAA15 family ATPase/GTPase
MHPFMAEMIIRLFNDPEVNPKGAQLVFTTHNVYLMSPELLRRDQIWLAEKAEGASTYFSLADFDKNVVKPQSPFNRWYLEGRFDAVPKIDYRRIANMMKTLRDVDAEEKD